MTRLLRKASPRGLGRRRRVAAGFVVAAAVLAVLVAVGIAWRQDRGPSRDAPAASGAAPRPERLRLLVADAPAPYVLDVERGSSERITGLPATGERGVSVLPVGKHALVLSQRYCEGCAPVSGVYVVRQGSAAATRLGSALQAVPSRDGDAVWMLGRQGAGRCAIRKIGLDGTLWRPPRAVSCRVGLVGELPAGLLVSESGRLGYRSHNALLKPRGRVVRLPYEQARPVVANLVATGADRRTPLRLRNVQTGVAFTLGWPSRPGFAFQDASGEATGARAIVEFARYSPQHRLDLWLLDTATRRWTRLPGMPAHLIPKVTDIKWTEDGRVVIFSGRALAVWRPGDARLAMRRVKSPKQPGNQFVIW